MAGFSIGAAINDAVGLIRRRPLSVFVWGLIVMAPSAASFALLWPMLGEMFAALALAPRGDGDFSDAAFADMMQFQAVSGLLNIVQLLVMVVVYTAVMRAVLRPDQSRFFSLRLGMDELRIGVVGIALVVGLYVAMMLMTLIGVAIGFAVWGAGSPLNWLAIVGLIVTAVLLMFVGMARVSLIAPASVLYRDFAFVQGWRLGRGQTGRLFGMMMILVLLIIVVEVVAVGIGLGVAGGLTASGAIDWNALRSENAAAGPFEGMSAMLAANWAWFVLGALIVAAIYGLLLTLQVGAFASACRQLAGDRTSPAVDEASPAPAG